MSFKFNILNDRPTGFKQVIVNTKGCYILVGESTFGNCQSFTIGYFNYFMSAGFGSNIKEKLRELKILCGIYKALLVVNVSVYYASRIRKIFHVVNEMKYTSSNGHRMVIMVIDTRK